APIDGHWPPPWLMNETIRAKLAGISRINIFTSRFSEHSIFGNFAERLAYHNPVDSLERDRLNEIVDHVIIARVLFLLHRSIDK
ncbi:hypothetical protein AAHH80_32415, partial [Burkholderia pseudomallei]